MLLGSVAITTGVVLAVTYIIINIIRMLHHWRQKVNAIRKIPGFPQSTLLGVLGEFPGPGESGLEFLRYHMQSYPRIIHLFAGPVQVDVMVLHPGPMKTIMKTSEPKPVESGGYFMALPWLGDGLLISGGRKWARNRKLLTPAFHFDILKPYVTINNRSADILLQKLSKNADNDEYFEVISYISLCTLEIILKCAFTFEGDVQLQGDNNPYVKTVQDLASLMSYRSLRPWLFPNFVFFLTPSGRQFKKCCDFAHSVSADVIKKRKRALEKDSKVPTSKILDFLDILLTAKDENGKGLTDREIRDEVDTFLFEGHDTTASGISWTLYALAENPKWQEKCREEIDEILEGRDSDEILWEDLSKMKVLAVCIKEVLRLHTPVYFIQRQTTKDMYLDGYWIPKGQVISLHLYAMMHNPAVWDEPMLFKPERFMVETEEKLDSYAFVPFSAGPRNCIGQNFAMHEMKVIVSRVLRRFTLEVDPVRPAKHQMMLVMKTEDGMYVKAKHRKP